MLHHPDVQAPGGVRLRRPACRRARGRGPPGCVRRRGRNACPVAEVVLHRTLVGLGRGGDTVHPGPATPCAASTSRRPSPPRCRRSGVTQRSLCWTGGGSVGGRGHRGSAAPAAHGVNPTPATAGRSPIPEGRGLPGRAGLAALLPARSRPGFRGRSAAWFRAGVGGRDLQGPSPQAQRCADVDKEGGTHQGRGLRSHGTTAIDKPLPDTKADCGSCWASSANRGTMLLVVDPLTSVAACRWRSPATRRHRLCRPAACRTPLHRAG
jgi:hypothetical protein